MRHKIIPYNPILKELAKKLRKNMTLSEVLLWNNLKQKQMRGYDFDRQRPIDNFIVDFYCKKLMLAIEVVGSCHNSEEAFIKVQRRQKILETLGVSFLRFDDIEVKEDIYSVLRVINKWIDKWETGNKPTPNPSKEGNS